MMNNMFKELFSRPSEEAEERGSADNGDQSEGRDNDTERQRSDDIVPTTHGTMSRKEAMEWDHE